MGPAAPAAWPLLLTWCLYLPICLWIHCLSIHLPVDAQVLKDIVRAVQGQVRACRTGRGRLAVKAQQQSCSCCGRVCQVAPSQPPSLTEHFMPRVSVQGEGFTWVRNLFTEQPVVTDGKSCNAAQPCAVQPRTICPFVK